MAVAALRHGIDVFGEKPLAHTLAEGRAVCDAVGQHGRIWQSGCWQRSVPAFRRAAELIRAGALGAVVRAEVGTYGGSPEARPVPDDYDKPPAHLDYARWVGPAAWTPYDSRVTHLRWRYVSNYGGGRLMDFVGHHLDIAHWALGLDATGPLAVAGTGTLAAHAPYDTEDVYTAECEYAGGLRIVISSEFTPGVKFFAADGNWLQVGRGRGINGAAFLHTSRPEILNAAVPESMRLYRSDNHWRNFIDCVKTRRPTIAPAEAGQRSTSVGHLAHIAIQLGRKLHWNPATEQFLDDPSANALLLPAHRA
jgi:predicted dehydrogenase